MASGNEFKDLLLLYRSIDHQYKLHSYTEKKLKSIQKSLELAEKDLLKELSLRDFRIPEGREHALLKQLNDMTFAIQAQLTGDIHEAVKVAGENAFREYGKILSFDGALDNTVGFNYVELSPSQFNAMVTAPVGGQLLEKEVKKSFASNIIDGIQTKLIAENLKGVSTPQIIAKMEEAFGMANRTAETLVRTHIASINNRAAEDIYKANADIVSKVEWSATFEVAMNGRGTCLQCAALNGQTWELKEEHPDPPIHPNCRCFILPKTKSYKELGLNIDEMERSLKPYTEREANRKIIEAGQMSGESFEKFLNSRAEKYKKDLLGPSRYAMLKKGDVQFKDFVDKNGQLRLLTKDREGLKG